jgi:DnaA family protein
MDLRRSPMQIPLNIHLPEIAAFESFIEGDNGLLLKLLKQSAQHQGELQIYCWAETGSGKSHLLQATCRLAVQHGHTASYLPLAQLLAYSPQIFENLESLQLVCIDDLDSIAGLTDWEQGLFSLINRCRVHGTRLVLAATKTVNDLNFSLPDLVSRLGWGPVFQIRPLSDADKLKVLQSRAQARGIELPDAVGQYMLRHYHRELRFLCEQLDTLDRASLVEQRRLTIPFIKSILNTPGDIKSIT